MKFALDYSGVLRKTIFALGACSALAALALHFQSDGIDSMGIPEERAIEPTQARKDADGILGWLGAPATGGAVVKGCRDAGRDGAYRYLIQPGENFDLRGLADRLNSDQTLARINGGPDNRGWAFWFSQSDKPFRDMGCCARPQGLRSPSVFKFSRRSGSASWRTVVISFEDKLIYLEDGKT